MEPLQVVASGGTPSRRFKGHSESSWSRETRAGGEAGGGVRAHEIMMMQQHFVCPRLRGVPEDEELGDAEQD
ncbi:hypothetical protein Bca4012_080635 [Brassica carinata]